MGQGVNGNFNNVVVELRRNNSGFYAFNNPVLASGEPAYETDTRRLKIGDGITPYISLPYFGNTGGGSSYTAGSGIAISGTNVISLVSNNISQFNNDSGYVTAAGIPLPAGEIGYGSASNALTGTPNLFFDAANTLVYIGGNTGAFPQTKLQIYDSVNGFSQSNYQNLSNGNTASSDGVWTADTGTNTTNYVNVGINNSGNTDAAFTIAGALDSYLYSNGGNLTIGTQSAKDIIHFTGGTLAVNEIARWSATPGGTSIGLFNIKGTVTASSNAATAQYITTTLTAVANNDVLIGIDVNPTFVPGAFTGVKKYGLRSTNADIIVNNTILGTNGVAGNTYFGANVMQSTTGVSCTAMGNVALQNLTTGNFNTAFGASVLNGITTTAGNSGFGRAAGFMASGAVNCTFVGLNAGNITGQTTSPTNQTVLGMGTFGDTDNQVFIGNTSVTAIKFGQSKLNFTIPAAATSVVFASGSTFTTAGAFAATNTYTATTNATFPAGTGTLAYLAGTNTWSGATTFSNTVTLSSTINKVTITPPTTAATLTLVTGSTLQTTGAFTINLTATANSTPTFVTGSGTVPYIGSANTWTAVQTYSATNLATDTTTGMQLWTSATQKGGFWGATPIVKPVGSGTAAAYTSVGGSVISTLDTFGTTNKYTVGQAFQRLIDIGLFTS